ncbi:MAG: HYR domain-containing protein [Acidobacteria bacterium]|nr:HYR domain-containing protein [Acidobacteriota bacterium]MBI3423869.1 HYR domain-containing protein [Acidobacteriota bacterium]
METQVSGFLARIGTAFGLAAPVQGGVGARTIISTIAGGGFSNNVPPREAPMVYPSATALDPLGRGFYVVDEVNNSSLLRFVNTTANAVTLAGATIPPGQIGLVAGSGAVPELGMAREVDLSLVTGLVVDPSGNAVYICTPLVNAIRVINVGTQSLTFFGATTAPGMIGQVFSIARPELRALAFKPQTRDFFYVSTLTINSTTKVIWRLDGATGQESVYAGGGEPGTGNGDNGAATEARIVSPLGMIIDSAGNLLIAEGGDARRNPGAVRKIDGAGTITSIASRLDFPTGLTLAPNGTIYVALGNRQQYARVDANGTVTAVVGDNSATVCDQLNRPTCGDGGLALAANITLPSSTDQRSVPFAADANGLFIPDFLFRRARYANLSNASVTVAGVSIGAKQINTVVGNGQEGPYDNIPATSSELQGSTGIAVDTQGNLFIADTTPSPISLLRYVNRGTTPVTLFGGTAWERTVQPGHIVTLNNNATIQRNDDRIITASFESPQGLFAVSNGLYIVDSQYGALIKPPNTVSGRRSGHIRFLNTSNAEVTLFPNNPANSISVPPGQIKDLVGVNDVVPNSGYGTNGNIGDGGPASRAVIFPTDVAVTAQGNIYIADQGSNRIRIVDGATGVIQSLRVPGADGDTPFATNGATGIAFDSQGRLLIADTKANRVLRQSGATFVAIADQPRGINRPRDVITDSAGNIYVTNSGTNQIMRIVAPTDALGTVSLMAGTGERGFGGDGGAANRARMDFPNPTGNFDIQYTVSLLALPDNSLLFTDTNNNRIRRLVQTPNQPPVLAAISNVTLNEGQTQTVNISATDGNNDPLTLTINNKPSFATFTPANNGTASLQLAPGFSDAGVYQISIVANDGDATDTKSFTVTVSDVNRAPTVSAQPLGSPLEANSPAGRQVTLVGTATDPDGDPVTYQWFDGATRIATTATANVTLAFGSHSITLRATDAKDASATTTPQTVVVQDTAPPVFANVPADVTTAATSASGATVTFTLPTATDAVDGPVTVTADPPSGALFTLGTTVVNFTAKDARNNIGRASFRITVNQGGGGPAPEAVFGNITTLAGNGNSGSSGDNGPATNATLREARALRVDRNNNVLFVDGLSRNVRAVNPQGVIRSVAGNGANANTGDGNLGIYASFGAPGGVAVDAQGNLYVSDASFHRVRRVTASDGRIAHFAGSPTGVSGSQGDNGAATAARLTRPTAIALDAQGNVYIADSGNHRIRRVDLSTNTITTYAGNGSASFSGDGGAATLASMNNPTGLAFDAQGNLFIADRNNQRIRRVDAVTKNISTIAGTGAQDFSGDDGPANNAVLNNPSDVAVDGNNNLYLVEQGNHRVRRVNAGSQVIKTVAGTGAQGFAGDGGPALQAQFSMPSSLAFDALGNLYVGDSANSRVRRIANNNAQPGNRAPVFTSNIGNQTLVKGQTLELAVSASDEDNDSVGFTLQNAPAFATLINVNPPQRTATLRLAPTETGTFNNLQIQASDGKGGLTNSAAFNVTVTEPSPNNRPPTANANAVASPLEAASAAGGQVALSGSGSDPDGDPITFAWFDGNTPIATSATATVILGIGTHSLRLAVSDNRGGTTSTPAQTVVVQDTTPPTLTNVPADVTTPAASASGANVTFLLPTATDLVDGNVAVTAEPTSGALFPVGTTTVNFTARDARGNVGRASFRITVTPSGGMGGGVTAFTISTVAGNGAYGFSGDGDLAVTAALRSTTALSFDKDGQLLIVDAQSRNVRRVFLAGATPGVIRTAAGNGANANSGDNGPAIYASFGATGGAAVAVNTQDAQGNIYVSDSVFHRVRKIGADGRIAHFAGSLNGVGGSVGDFGSATSARLNRPGALAVDAQNNVYIADMANQRIRRVDAATGLITTYAGNGGAGFGGDNGPANQATLNNPTGLAFDAQGNLYIADRGNQRIRRVDAVSKTITTAAGDGTQNFGGEDGPATNAQFNNPSDIGVDGNGNLYIVDQGNHRVRRVDGASRLIKTIAGNGVAGFDGDGGAAAQAKLNLPSSVTVAADGSVFIGDAGNLRVRKLTPAGPANRAPVITTTLGEQTLTRGQTLDVPLSATDEDGDPVTFTLLNAPGFASIVNANPAQRTATLRLTPTTAGMFDNVRVQAEDSKGGKTPSAAFTIKVNEASSCAANVPAERWKGEYFSNRLLQGTPVLVRDDGAGNLNFSFGLESPSAACNVPVDNFSIRWTRAVNFDAGVYRFAVTGDDGVRLYVDDVIRLDQWKDQSETSFTADVQLSAGLHTLRFEHYDAGGLAAARLSWAPVTVGNHAPVIETIPNQTVVRGQTIEVEIRATDADGDPVTFALENAPAFITLTKANSAQRTATLHIAPPAGDNTALYTLRINANDGRGGVSTSNPFTLTVADNLNNQPPVAVANRLPDTLIANESGQASVQLDGSASSDPEGDQLSFTWLDRGTAIASGAVAEVRLPLGEHLLALRVSDGRGGVSTTNAQKLTVLANNAASLSVTSVSPSMGKAGKTVTITLSGTGFVPGTQVQLSGGGITTATTYLNSTQLNVRVVISTAALTNLRNLIITNPSGETLVKANAFAVSP